MKRALADIDNRQSLQEFRTTQSSQKGSLMADRKETPDILGGLLEGSEQDTSMPVRQKNSLRSWLSRWIQRLKG